jgi:signal transduction histidine kinase
MWKIKKGKNFYLIFSVMGLVVSLSVCSIMYFQFHRFTEDSYFTILEDTAVMVEHLYPAIYDIDSMKKGFLNNEDWVWKIHDEWVEILNAYELAYIYYMDRSDDGTEYLEIMDTYFTRDMDISWLGAEVWKDDPIPPGVDDAWDTQKIAFSPYPSVEEQWGIVVSAYLPIVKDGQTIGILGVDYDISYVNAMRNRILLFLVFSFVISVALTGVLAYIGSRSVLVTIEEREKTTREAVERQMEIEKLMNALKKSSEARTAFLSSISSSMADPINHIIRLSSLLSKYTEISEDHQKNLEIINDEGMKLFDVINDILDILKIEAGKLKFNPVKFKLPEFISEVTSTYMVYTESKPIQYKLVIDENLPVNLAGDELRIKQICHYLLTNAFKYTNTGSITVNITSKLKNEYVLLIMKIADTGVGMTEEKLNTIFTNYGQGSGGLGLFLCKQLAEIMKGTLSVTSELGKGSVFTLCIPQKLLSNETIGPETAKKLAAFKF